MKKRIKIKIVVLIVALISIGFLARSFFSNDHKEASVKSLPLDWPAVGQAAIGSVKDGLLASSTENEKVRPIASMAKVITALAIMEKQPIKNGQKGQTYTITKNDIASLRAYISGGGSVLPIRVGMRITQYQAMQRMLIASDNNMSDILVERIFGSMEAYVSYAQKMIRRLGLNKTVVADASGFSAATVSTPSELVAIGIAALKNPVIAEIVAQQRTQMPVVGIIENTNQLLGTEGVIGIKTGTTNKAGSCLLFAARHTVENGQTRTIVGVIMGDRNHRSLYADSKRLLASAKQCFGLPENRSAANLASPSQKQSKNVPPKK
jgi:D-alanyl-D-alanine carboxypeptidase (penicillin-binding protein 5/6)